jgi:ABC-type Fe3+/spermidine/putrescine transport system ATPase subunit
MLIGADDASGLRGTVSETIFEGANRHVLVDVDGVALRVQEPASNPSRTMGDRVSLTWDRRSEVIFP